MWQSRPISSAAWISDGLAKLDGIHSSLEDFLQHPQALDPLHRRSAWITRALDDFLRFADAYTSLRFAIVALGDRHLVMQAAVRRSDGPRIASCARAQRRAERELVRIAAAVKGAGRWIPPAARNGSRVEAELVGTIREVAAVTAAASAAAIAGVAELSSAARATTPVVVLCSSLRSVVGPKVAKKKLKEEDFGAMEECIWEVEKRSERLIKKMVNTRVFLLNILTPSIS